MFAPVEEPGGDPLAAFHFQLEVGGITTGFFTEMSGIGSETEIIEHRVVNEKGQEIIMKIPGRLKFNNVTLKRGVTSNLDVWTWRKMVEDGNITEARANATLTMLNQELTPVARWDLVNCWPSSIHFGDNTNSGLLAVEEIVLVCESYQRVE
jgi:phage tail-like protein